MVGLILPIYSFSNTVHLLVFLIVSIVLVAMAVAKLNDENDDPNNDQFPRLY